MLEEFNHFSEIINRGISIYPLSNYIEVNIKLDFNNGTLIYGLVESFGYSDWEYGINMIGKIDGWNTGDESMAQMESQIEAELIEESITTNRQGDKRVNRI